jgi:hypothetical protein
MRIPNLISKISTSHSKNHGKDLSTVVTHIVGQLEMSPRACEIGITTGTPAINTLGGINPGSRDSCNLQKETEKTQNNQQNIVEL